MTYTSIAFLVAVTVAVILYRLCPVRLRSAFLLITSYGFYCTWSPKLAVALAGATIVSFFAAKWTGDPQSPHRARIAALGVTLLLAGYLTFFKFAAITSLAGLGRMALPLGVSYYTFKLISYIMDTYWGKVEPEPRFIPFAAYVAFFPQIIAGPIQRPGDFLSQMPPLQTAVSEGLPRIVWGLVKKLVVADQLAQTVGYVFNHMHALQGAPLLLGFYLFPIQLYADFSGLTDIAIGIGLLFGVRSPENFNRPFTATTITDFWRRWHISLTSWLGDYVFTPLRMATRSLGNTGLSFSIVVNTVAIGLWHGFSWGYFAFGLMHGGYIVTEALTTRKRSRFFKSHPHLNAAGDWLGRFYVFHAAAIAFLFFRAPKFADAFWGLTHLLARLSFWRADLLSLSSFIDVRPLAISLAGCVLIECVERFHPGEWLQQIALSLPVDARQVARAAVLAELGAAVLLLLAASSGMERAFIYEAF
jgi:D-alanyl-lipoteichoic acid acyltransferase DltB (MBOAT superfamily)